MRVINVFKILCNDNSVLNQIKIPKVLKILWRSGIPDYSKDLDDFIRIFEKNFFLKEDCVPDRGCFCS